MKPEQVATARYLRLVALLNEVLALISPSKEELDAFVDYMQKLQSDKNASDKTS